MTTHFDKFKVLEQCQISPPPKSVPITSLPFTFFDIPFFTCCPIQRVFLYQAPFSAAQFLEEVIPHLKNSLSLALQQFFPFCGNAVCPPTPKEPYILYNEGDSVPLLIAQSSGDFGDFLKDGPKDIVDIHPLLPPTPPTRALADTLVEMVPLLAVQVTLFPNSGIAVGITYRHVVADGKSSLHFIKTWASILKAGCDMSRVCISLPNFDKGVIKDPDMIKDIVLKQWRASGSPTSKEPGDIVEGNVRVTFTLSKAEIDRLKKWVMEKVDNGAKTMPNLHFSSFVVTCAFIWACMIKSLDTIKGYAASEDELCHIIIVADCRNRYGLGIPTEYFGNCLTGKFVSVARCKFREENWLATVAEALSRGVHSFKEGTLDGYKNEKRSKWCEFLSKGENILTIAGSPKLAAYETDFGWGRPEKVEVVHIDNSGSISLSESRNEIGGIEIGLCRSQHEMEIVTSFFEAGIQQFD